MNSPIESTIISKLGQEGVDHLRVNVSLSAFTLSERELMTATISIIQEDTDGNAIDEGENLRLNHAELVDLGRYFKRRIHNVNSNLTIKLYPQVIFVLNATNVHDECEYRQYIEVTSNSVCAKTALQIADALLFAGSIKSISELIPGNNIRFTVFIRDDCPMVSEYIGGPVKTVQDAEKEEQELPEVRPYLGGSAALPEARTNYTTSPATPVVDFSSFKPQPVRGGKAETTEDTVSKTIDEIDNRLTSAKPGSFNMRQLTDISRALIDKYNDEDAREIQEEADKKKKIQSFLTATDDAPLDEESSSDDADDKKDNN